MAKKKKSRINITRLNISTKKAVTIAFSIILFCVVLLAVTIAVSQPKVDKKTKEVTKKEQVQKAPKTSSKKTETTQKKETPKTEIPQSSSRESSKKTPEEKNKTQETKKTQTTQNVVTQKTEQKKETTTAQEKTSVTPKQEVDIPVAKPGSKGTIILVLDDAGHNLNHLAPYLQLPFPCTIAVLPGLAHSVEAAQKIRQANKELILHQPMQSLNLDLDPGPNAITPSMYTLDIERTVTANIKEIGPIAGMNNHEGSLITETEWAIGSVLDVCDAHGIYFLDSRTTANTKAPAAAQERGMTIYQRDIFIDNSPDKNAMKKEIEKGLAIAEKKGLVIMIGHIRPHGLDALLQEMYPQLVKQGYAFKTITQIKK